MKPRSRLIVCGAVLCTWCIALSVQSYSFSWGRPLAHRPVLTFTTGLLFATGISLLALREAVRCRHAANVGGIILGLAIMMRLIMVPSHPIQELDTYRYIWDGLVVTETGNPWQFSPALVRTAARDTGPEELRQLTALRDTSHGIRTTLDRIHYARLTTIYPPVSQGVFAAAAFVTPIQATARTRLIVIRTVITVFDLLTILAILRLLRLAGKPAAGASATRGHLWYSKSLPTAAIWTLLLSVSARGRSSAGSMPYIVAPLCNWQQVPHCSGWQLEPNCFRWC